MSGIEYQVTREQCEARISGVCPGCGGVVVALRTVDNARQPTYWSACQHCGVFTDGVPAATHALARQLVEEGTLVPWGYQDKDEPRWLESNTRKAAQILRRINALQSIEDQP